MIKPEAFGFGAWLAIGLAISVAVFVYPAAVSLVAYRIAWIALAVDLLSLPFALIKRARGIVCLVLMASSIVFAAALWCFSAGITFAFWGYTGLIIGIIFAGVGVFGIALLTAALHSDWVIVANLLVGLFLAVGAPTFSLWLGSTVGLVSLGIKGDKPMQEGTQEATQKSTGTSEGRQPCGCSDRYLSLYKSHYCGNSSR